MSPQTAKTCVVCGKDCANSPRVKDPRGRYFCKPCYEAAMRNKKQPVAGDSRHDDDDHDDRRKPTAGWGGSLLDDDLRSAAACPECNAALDDGAVLCVNCGYVLRAGKHITPEVVEEGEEESGEEGDTSGRTKWPIVIGVVSLIFAVFGALGYGVASIGSLLTSPAEAGGPLFWAFFVVSHPILLALSIGLGVLGIGLIRRRAFGPLWLARWAWAKIAVSVLYAVVVGAKIAVDTPAELVAFGAVVMVIVVPILLIWLLFWPVFLLLWLRRKTIKSEISAWR